MIGHHILRQRSPQTTVNHHTVALGFDLVSILKASIDGLDRLLSPDKSEVVLAQLNDSLEKAELETEHVLYYFRRPNMNINPHPNKI